MSGDTVTVAEIVEHAYRCGAVKVTNYRDVDGLAIETFELVGGKPVVAGTEYVTDTEYGDEVWASFTNETRVSIRLQFGQVGEVRVAPGPGDYFSDARQVWPGCTDWRETLAYAGAQP